MWICRTKGRQSSVENRIIDLNLSAKNLTARRRCGDESQPNKKSEANLLKACFRSIQRRNYE